MKLTPASVVGSLLLLLATPSPSAAALDQCTVSLASLLSDPELNKCLPFPQLAKFLTDPITPQLVNDTATQFCSFPDCGQPSLTLVQNTVVQNCIDNSTTDNSTSDLVYGAAALYVPAKQGLCQRVPSAPGAPANGTFCVTELATSMTAYLAVHPSPLGIKIFANATVLKEFVDAMPKELLCTACNKAIINPLDNYIAANQATLNAQVKKWASVIQTEVQLKCGSDFTDGATPVPSANTGGGSTSLGVVSEISRGSSVLAAVVVVAAALFL
ncbi:hypothetical protein MVEG_08915 [Podila verticillata NRRL 6337]|nr:MAG: hypothetical protein BYD32DRAFT_426080 [Podila humilis]KFH65437.1 hypothetical protein MVEG_08915 [Podila verticillata NRRL 6337]